ncbi:MAG: hypothetical protein RIC56_10230 [Pseudomonadales bacterium]
MDYLVGLSLAFALLGSSTVIGFDRDRVLYPIMLIVIASYYVLFAAMGASTRALILDGVAAGVFVVAAVIGFRFRLWLVVAALVGHGIFDFVHQDIIGNPGVPDWWPGFCLAFDGVAAGYLAVLLTRRPALAG